MSTRGVPWGQRGDTWADCWKPAAMTQGRRAEGSADYTDNNKPLES